MPNTATSGTSASAMDMMCFNIEGLLMNERLRRSLKAGEGRSAPDLGEGGWQGPARPAALRQLGALTPCSGGRRRSLLPHCVIAGPGAKARAPNGIMIRMLLVPGALIYPANDGRPGSVRREKRAANPLRDGSDETAPEEEMGRDEATKWVRRRRQALNQRQAIRSPSLYFPPSPAKAGAQSGWLM